MDILLYIIAGASVGFIVGLTGIGGGALMTPLLLLFGFPPNIAIGTDLMYAGLTKTSGAVSHHKQGHVNWSILKYLALGSIPATVITGMGLSHFFETSDEYGYLLTSVLGVMLLVTAVAILFRSHLQRWSAGLFEGNTTRLPVFTTLMGVMLGVLVTLSSVGAGAIGTAILMILYPALRSTHIIGTDIAHAVPLTLVAGAIHFYLGNVDLSLLGALLVGSIPAIHVASRLSKHIPEPILRNALASLLFGLGVKYALF